MGFLDKLKETAGNVAGAVKEGAAVAADKAKDLAETAKQKGIINDAEKGIKEVYGNMGKTLLEEFPDIAKEKFPDAIAKIDEFKATIEAAKAAIAALAADDPRNKAQEAPAEAPKAE